MDGGLAGRGLGNGTNDQSFVKKRESSIKKKDWYSGIYLSEVDADDYWGGVTVFGMGLAL